MTALADAWPGGLKFTEKSDICFRTISGASTSDISVTYDLILVRN